MSTNGKGYVDVSTVLVKWYSLYCKLFLEFLIMTTLVMRFTFKMHSVVESTCTVYEYIQHLALYMFFFPI